MTMWMEGNGKRNQQSSSQLSKNHQLLRKILQFLVSVCFLSILVSNSSSISNFMHLLTLPYPLLNLSLGRKYMFLLCNGIVAVLAKNMNLSGDSPVSEDGLEVMSQIEAPQEGEQENEKEIEGVSLHEKERKNTAMITIEGQEEDFYDNDNKSLEGYGSSTQPLTAAEERESPALITRTEDQEEEECSYDDDSDKILGGSGSLTPQSIAEDGGYQMDMSTEELNRKIEEFIRKMKEEIKIGAQQELITVQSAS